MKKMGWLLLFVSLISFAFSSKKSEEPISTHVQNPAFSKEKIPKEGEKAIEEKYAKKQWTENLAKPKPKCQSGRYWMAENDDNVRVVAFKNKNLPVKGIFERTQIFIQETDEGKSVRGWGSIDLSSYNTGNEARDRRVQRLIFDVENPRESSIAEFTFEMDDWPKKASKGDWKTQISFDLEMRGNNYQFKIPALFNLRAKTLKLKSLSDGRINFATQKYLRGILALMSACNHQSIASFADINFDVEFKAGC